MNRFYFRSLWELSEYFNCDVPPLKVTEEFSWEQGISRITLILSSLKNSLFSHSGIHAETKSE